MYIHVDTTYCVCTVAILYMYMAMEREWANLWQWCDANHITANPSPQYAHHYRRWWGDCRLHYWSDCGKAAYGIIPKEGGGNWIIIGWADLGRTVDTHKGTNVVINQRQHLVGHNIHAQGQGIADGHTCMSCVCGSNCTIMVYMVYNRGM